MDFIAANIQRLRASPGVVAAVGGDPERIASQRPRHAAPDGRFLALVAVPGGGNDPDLPYFFPYLDAFAYAETAAEAYEVYWALYRALIPPERGGAFTQSGVRIVWTKLVNGPVDDVDEGWPVVWATLRQKVREV